MAAALIGCPIYACAYEVWMGTLGWQQGLHDHPDQWAQTAAAVEGLNANWAHGLPDTNRLNKAFRRAVIARMTNASNQAYQVLPHGSGAVTADSEWSRLFSRAEEYGYKLGYLYTYNSGPGRSWLASEHEELRTWLDHHGHADVKIAFNGRSGHGQLERPVIQGGGIECDLQSWKDDKGERFALLRWMADPTNSATRGEKIIIHCHLNYGKADNPADLVNAWAGARLMVRDIGRDVMNTDALRDVFRSDRFVFSFFGGNWTTPAISLLPETTTNGTYAESYTGLLLSLIEQRALFEGRSEAFPSDAQCRSFERQRSAATAAGTP